MDARALAGALARTVLVAYDYRGPRIAVALLRDALNALSDEHVEAELRATAMLPPEVMMALECDDLEVAVALEGDA